MILPNTRGQNNRQAKLTDAQAEHVRRCVLAGVERRELAAMFGVSLQTINRIAARRRLVAKAKGW